MKFTQGNTIYNLMVEGYLSNYERAIRTSGELGYGEGITAICVGRGTGHTTAILQLFSENAENSYFLTPVANKQVKQLVPYEYHRRIGGLNDGPSRLWMVMEPPTYIFIDFCGVITKVRLNVMNQILGDGRTLRNLKHIFTVQ